MPSGPLVLNGLFFLSEPFGSGNGSGCGTAMVKALQDHSGKALANESLTDRYETVHNVIRFSEIK
jgi:hypothetical protein